jgi:putative Mn2+ efflux pump MntP
MSTGEWVQILLIAVALSLDAFAVAVAEGIVIRRLQVAHALKLAAWFGGFQALMPLLGWWCGGAVREYISHWDHWVAFGLLVFVGGKMIHEAVGLEEAERRTGPAGGWTVFVLAVATSLDALAVGFTFALQATPILAPVLIIGGITFVLIYLGVWVGTRFGHFFEKRIEVVGGVILIGIGLKILLEHLLS